MDWKIVGASVVALLMVSGLFASSLEINDFFSSIFDKLRGWLGESPFEGFFTSPVEEPHSVLLTLKGDLFELRPTKAISISSSTSSFNKFQGRLNISFVKNKIYLYDPSTGFTAEFPIDNFVLDNVTFSSATFENVGIDIKSYINAEKATAIINDFYGTVKISDGITLEGNVSNLRVKIDDLNWELK